MSLQERKLSRCLLMVLLIGLPTSWACTSTKNTIVEAGTGNEASPAAIDEDPWALLPAGPVAWAYLDAPALFGSRFGPTLVNLVSRRIPALGTAQFEPQRDIEAMHLGVYSIQGADVVGVVTGRFNREHIEASVEQNPVTPLGVQLTKTLYGERTLFMAEESGFCIVTERTALVGNQMGMRRAIDRIRGGKLARALPAWLESQIQKRQAPIIVGMNLTENPLSAATLRELPFLNGMGTLGVLANFQDPGVNVAGTATYQDENAARSGADSLRQLNDYLQQMGVLMALFGISQPLKSLVTEARGREARFVAQVEGAALDRMLSQLDAILPGVSSAPTPGPAPGAPPVPGAAPPGAP